MENKVDNVAYRMTFVNLLVMWRPNTESSQFKGPMLVLNPQIPLAKYTFSYDPATFAAVATTPSMNLTSMSLSSASYQTELEFSQSTYSNTAIMKRYNYGVTQTADQVTALYAELASRWTTGCPYSGLMARNAAGDLVAMLSLNPALDQNGNVTPGAATFSAIINSGDPSQDRTLILETIILLLVIFKYLSDNGYEISGAPLQTVGRTNAFKSNSSNDRFISALFFRRNRKSESVQGLSTIPMQNINAIFAHTALSQQEDGTFLAKRTRPLNQISSLNRKPRP